MGYGVGVTVGGSGVWLTSATVVALSLWGSLAMVWLPCHTVGGGRGGDWPYHNHQELAKLATACSAIWVSGGVSELPV